MGTAAILFVFPQFGHAYVIRSGSMENTILVGDRLLAFPINSTPQRGELVIHRYPLDSRQTFVKRVVAIAGDRVRLKDKQLIVNGSVVKEPYAIHREQYVDTFRDNFPADPPASLQGKWAEELASHVVNGELVVPPGKYFVLGDNRDDSLDSRYFGFLDRADLLYRPSLIYFSADGAHVRWDRILKGL